MLAHRREFTSSSKILLNTSYFIVYIIEYYAQSVNDCDCKYSINAHSLYKFEKLAQMLIAGAIELMSNNKHYSLF